MLLINIELIFSESIMSYEKFCLKWTDFEHFAAKSFNNLREEKDFFDVTLVSEDLVQFDSHKVVLSASSKFFKNILRLNKHNHPLLYLQSVHSTLLQFVCLFLRNTFSLQNSIQMHNSIEC